MPLVTLPDPEFSLFLPHGVAKRSVQDYMVESRQMLPKAIADEDSNVLPGPVVEKQITPRVCLC
jgi:hypothetical protein